MSCAKPKPTKRVLNPGTGVRAWCSGCKNWKPAGQVSWGQELRRKSDGKIIATFAPIAH